MDKIQLQSELVQTIGFEDIEKILTRYMKLNNFRQEEIEYIYHMLNTFSNMNIPKIRDFNGS